MNDSAFSLNIDFPKVKLFFTGSDKKQLIGKGQILPFSSSLLSRRAQQKGMYLSIHTLVVSNPFSQAAIIHFS